MIVPSFTEFKLHIGHQDSPSHKAPVYKNPWIRAFGGKETNFKMPRAPLRYSIANASDTWSSTVAIDPALSSPFHSSSEMKMVSC